MSRAEEAAAVIDALINNWGLSEEAARRALKQEGNVARSVLDNASPGYPLHEVAAAAADAVIYRAYPEIARERVRFIRARRR